MNLVEYFAERDAKNRVLFEHRNKDGELLAMGESTNLRTTVGADWQADVMGNSTQPASARWIGLTTNASAASAASTTLTSEIASGGLTRAVGTYAHTASTSSYTITVTFTASATHTAVHRAGLFNAISSGTLVFETVLSSDVTLVSGDTLTITWTVNI